MAAVTSLGLGRTMEKKLHAVGIHSAEELAEIGSRQAVFRLNLCRDTVSLRSSYSRGGDKTAWRFLQSGAEGLF